MTMVQIDEHVVYQYDIEDQIFVPSLMDNMNKEMMVFRLDELAYELLS
jgi:hypothetical protein